MHSERRSSIVNQEGRISTKYILDVIYEEMDMNPNKIGVIFCEGDENSIDIAVYSVVYPDFIIIPVGSCCRVRRILNQVITPLWCEEIFAFGIIDRDDLTKREIKQNMKKALYCTKLPFIENIICTPEVIQCVCDDVQLDYEKTIRSIKNQLVKVLWKNFREALPINIGFMANEKILDIRIGASTRRKTLEKSVNSENILYTYRSKIVASIVSSQLGIKGRTAYYQKIKEMLENEKYRNSLKRIMATYLPVLEEYNLDE